MTLSKITTLLVAVALAACGRENPTVQVPPKCGVTDEPGIEQALSIRIFSFIALVVPEDLGGLRCVPGRGDVCEAAQVDCVADAGDVQVGEERVMDILVENPSPVTLGIFGIVLSDDTCGAFFLFEDVPQTVESREAESIAISFRPLAAGVCSVRLDVLSDAENAPRPDRPTSVTLLANGVE